MTKLSAEQIDSVLPQTQCGLCGYGGCLPYAKAIATEKAPINLCPPGGVMVLEKLAELTQQSAQPYEQAMCLQEKVPQIAVIDENLCIGCTKCLPVCPVDAIIGAAKQMHTILNDACTGCGLCLPPCPMDCISLQTREIPSQTERDAWRLRHQRHLARLSLTRPTEAVADHIESQSAEDTAALAYIAAAVARKKIKN